MLSMPRIVRPDPLRFFCAPEIGSPAGSTARRSIKRNKELPKASDPTNPESSQALILVTIVLHGDCLPQLNAQTHYGLHC
jgi:hypothetical protein